MTRYDNSPRCVSVHGDYRCRLPEMSHHIVNGRTEHKWWGAGGQREAWPEDVYLTADEIATRMSRRIGKELDKVKRERDVSASFLLGATWAQMLVEGADVSEVAS